MNLEELLKKPFKDLTKEEIEWAFTQINWEELTKAYIAQQNELQRQAENNQDNQYVTQFYIYNKLWFFEFKICQFYSTTFYISYI